MLDQHPLNRFLREIGIYGLAAECVEVFKTANERRVALLLLVNRFLDGGGEFGDALGEIADCCLPLFNMRRFVIEELIDDVNQRCGAGNVFVNYAGSALIEDGTLGGLENNVIARISPGELPLDFANQIIFLVFGFPVAVRQVVEINERTVNDDG